MRYADAVQARANTPQPVSSGTEFDYAVQDLADEFSTLGNSGLDPQVEPQGEAALDDAMNRMFGETSSPYDEPGDKLEKSTFGAGIDQGQHLFYQGGKAFAQYLGLDDAEQWFQEGADINLADATVPLEGYKDMIIYGAGTVGATVPAMLAGLVAAPLVGLSGTVGLSMGAALAGIGMTNGDIQTKSEELAKDKGEEYTASGGALVTGTALGAMDMFAIKKLKTVLSPLAEVIKETAKGATKSTTLAGSAARVATGAVQIGGAEALQDAAASVSANVLTDTEIDESRVNAIANAAIDEFIVGAALGVPLSGLNVMTENIGIENANKNAEMREQLENMTDEEKLAVIERDEEGNMVVNTAALERMVPTESSGKQPSLISRGFHALTGNATDLLKAKYQDNAWVQAIGQQFNINPKERTPGKFTLTEEGQGRQAELFKIANPFLTASEADQQAAVDAKARGEINMENPVEASLYNLLNGVIPAMYQKAVRKEGKLGGMFSREDYFPSNLAVDMELIAKDEANATLLAREDLLKRYTEDSAEFKSGMNAWNERIREYKAQGNNLSYSPQTSLRIETYLAKAVEEGAKPKTLKKLVRKMEKARQKDSRRSPLNTQRQLQNFSQEFLNQYYSKSKTPKDIINQHIKQVSEHAALVERFGEDFEVFDEMVARAITEGNEKNKPIDPNDISKMYDVLRTQQRIHLRPIDPFWRNIQNKARAATNLRLLGLSALVSIPESLVIFMNTGGSATLKGLLQTMRITKDTSIASKDLGMSLDLAMNHAANRVNEESFDIPGWEQTFFKYFTGLPQLQHFLTTWATRSQDIYIKRMVDKIDSGKISKAESDMFFLKLHEAGIDLQGFQQWKQKEYALDDPYFTDSYAPALVGLVRDTIVDPNPIDKPLWMNDERFLLVAQLKGFMTTFTNRVMRGNWLKTRALAGNQNLNLIRQLALPVAAYLAAQVGIQAIREFANTGDTEKFDETDWGARITRAFSYLGAFGFFADAYNSFAYRRSFVTSQIPAAGLITSAIEGGIQVINGQNPDEAMGKLVSGIVPNMPGGGFLKANTEEMITDMAKEAGL